MAHHPLGPEFERRAAEAIAEIERGTAAEVVVVVTPRADAHRDVPLVAGLVALVATFTALVFAEDEVGDYTLYLAPLAALFVAHALVAGAPPLLRALEARFTAALAARSPGEAVLEALRALGAVLRERLPPRPDDVDELPSTVRVTF